MLRIQFTAEDLARVRVATRMDPLWEIIGSLHVLQAPSRPLVYTDWVRLARRQLARHRTRSAARVLTTLAPRKVYFPDFLTPAEPPSDLEQEIDTVLSTPKVRIRHELGRLSRNHRLPPWTRPIAAGEPDALAGLGAVLTTWYGDAVALVAPYIETMLADERARRAQVLFDEGVDGLLSSLGPSVRWRPPVLEVSYPADRTLDLAGRGLLLVPSYFTWGRPVTLADHDLSPVLVYPVEHHVLLAQGGDGLEALLGPTRAAVLEAVGAGATTSDVARQVGIAPATASYHASILREAGLLTSSRDANRVLHSLTRLGPDLLDRAGGRRGPRPGTARGRPEP